MKAARCLLIMRDLAGPDGKVPGGQRAIAASLRIDLRNVRAALAELEDRRLARRIGTLDVVVGGRFSSAVDEQVEPPPLVQRWRRDRGRPRNIADARYPGSGGDPEFRWLRAQVGGLKRTVEAHRVERDELRALVARLEKRSDEPEKLALKADLDHAADCVDPSCALCMRIIEQIEDPDGPYLSVVGGG